ncbi:glycoside hydrolase superfamily [Armillaria novae-zelandiae]|uniref:Glycoside hydrolase superfamily n=1 Tax=Armillaria novae-zelandiae TaxID=153914 RepID=A0AA39PVJ5_9AGAR|nr:glycoside hydrolase superfamily [Armillaria novae-zelandiae]
MAPKHILLRLSFLILACGLVRVWAAPLPSAVDVYERADPSVALVRSFPGSGTKISRDRFQEILFLLLLLLPLPVLALLPPLAERAPSMVYLQALVPSLLALQLQRAPSPEATGAASGDTQDPSKPDGDKTDDGADSDDNSTTGDDKPSTNNEPLDSDSDTGDDTSSGGESSSTGQSGSSQGPFSMAYFPDWAGVTAEQLDFKVFDWIDFAFALPSSSGTVGFQDESSETKLLAELVKAAHAANTKVKLSVGGWTGSKDFSKIVSSEQGRSSLAKSMLSLYKKYELDGIDIDWEYPGQAGDTSAFQKDDSANFLTFLQLLRKTLPSGAKISAAVQPYHLPSSTPGPNAPLGSCSNAKRPDANAKGGLKAWTKAGFPANQIVLGIASYGYISKSTAKELVIRNRRLGERQETPEIPGTTGAGANGPADVPTSAPTGAAPGASATSTAASSATQSSTPAGGGDAATDSTDGGDNGDEGPDDTTNDSSSGAGDSDKASSGSGGGLTPDSGGKNMIMFKSLVKQGALTSDYKGAKGFTRLWDKCSSTPFLRSESAGQVVSYDDPQSIMLKGQFVKTSGMLGTNMWDINGDTKDWALMNAARKGMGLSSKASSSSSPASGGAFEDTGGSNDGTTGDTKGLVEQSPDTGGDSAGESSSGSQPDSGSG